MRAAGSPGTCGANYRVPTPSAALCAPENPANDNVGPTTPQKRSTGEWRRSTALPAPRTEQPVTDGAFPSAASVKEKSK